MMRRQAVAGLFYPVKPDGLAREIARCLSGTFARKSCKAIVVPHAGYPYSGDVAGQIYARTHIPRTCILAGPNHTGRARSLFSVYTKGTWETPLGALPVEETFTAQLVSASTLFQEDALAHTAEHCLEVQLPFIQTIRPSAHIVPIVVASADIDDLISAGRMLGEQILKAGEEILLVASTDMTHYEPQSTAEKKDRLALENILAIDPEALARVVESEHISMCGWASTVMVLAACQVLGAKKGSLIVYRTSGDKTGDQDRVVGYAGVMIE